MDQRSYLVQDQMVISHNQVIFRKTPKNFVLSSGTREVHNKLEKKRRAHLKACFDKLKANLPKLVNDKKPSNLTILRSAFADINRVQEIYINIKSESELMTERENELHERVESLKKELELKYKIIDWQTVLPNANTVFIESTSITKSNDTKIITKLTQNIDDDSRSFFMEMDESSMSNDTRNECSMSSTDSNLFSPTQILAPNVVTVNANDILPPEIHIIEAPAISPCVENLIIRSPNVTDKKKEGNSIVLPKMHTIAAESFKKLVEPSVLGNSNPTSETVRTFKVNSGVSINHKNSVSINIPKIVTTNIPQFISVASPVSSNPIHDKISLMPRISIKASNLLDTKNSIVTFPKCIITTKRDVMQQRIIPKGSQPTPTHINHLENQLQGSISGTVISNTSTTTSK